MQYFCTFEQPSFPFTPCITKHHIILSLRTYTKIDRFPDGDDSDDDNVGDDDEDQGSVDYVDDDYVYGDDDDGDEKPCPTPTLS